MPRTGTTLVEQILSSHSQVEGTSELADMPAIARQGRRYPAEAAKLTVDERCEAGGGWVTGSGELFQDWQQWCQANGGPGWGGKTFTKALDERGFPRAKSGSVRGFRGIRLRPQPGVGQAAGGWEGVL